MVRLADDHPPFHPHDSTALAQYELHDARVLLPTRRPLRGERRRHDLVQLHQAAFGLGHNLLCNDQNVAVLERRALLLERSANHRGQVGIRLDLANAENRQDLQPSRHQPITSMRRSRTLRLASRARGAAIDPCLLFAPALPAILLSFSVDSRLGTDGTLSSRYVISRLASRAASHGGPKT